MVDISGYQVVLNHSGSPPENFTYTLPTPTEIPAGDTIKFEELVGGVPEISASGSDPTIVLLCTGDCNATTNTIIDAVAINNSHPTLPSGVNFTPAPLMGSSAEEIFIRVAFDGSFPNFVESDWEVDSICR